MIPYGKQSIDDADIEAVVRVLRSDFLTQGPMVAAFEQDLARHCDAPHAVACNNGTAALHMAYAALGIGSGDVVVVPANTFLATANAAVYLGASVRFCDVDPRSGLMTPRLLAEVLDEAVSLVVPVHFAGMPCAMQEIWEVVRAKAPQARLVEDASHAIGAVHRDGRPVGSLHWSEMATFSFHPVKHVAAGEGGAVTCQSEAVQGALQSFRCHGMTKDRGRLTRPDEGPWYYEMHSPGMNYRIPDVLCALAKSQLSKLGKNVARRRQIAREYLRCLCDLPFVELPDPATIDQSSWHLFCLYIDFKAVRVARVDWMGKLRQRGVGTQVHYVPVSFQPFYRHHSPADSDRCVGAMQHYRTALSLPMYPSMTDQDVATVCEAFLEVHADATRQLRTAA